VVYRKHIARIIDISYVTLATQRAAGRRKLTIIAEVAVDRRVE